MGRMATQIEWTASIRTAFILRQNWSPVCPLRVTLRKGTVMPAASACARAALDAVKHYEIMFFVGVSWEPGG